MIGPTPEQIEAAAKATYGDDADWGYVNDYGGGEVAARWEHLGVKAQDLFLRKAHAALVAAAGALLVAPALSVSEYRSQSGDADRNGGEDGPEHERGSHPETVAADTAELIAEARSRAEHPGTGSNTAQCLRECADALEAAGNAPVQVDEAKLAEAIGHALDAWQGEERPEVFVARAIAEWLRAGGR